MEINNVRGEEEERERQFESLYEAAMRWNANDISQLLERLEPILDQVMSDCVVKDNHPIHIGALFGNVKFVREILNLKPKLTREINSQGLSPLHVASEKGHLEVVRVLLEKDAHVCFLRDAYGRTPLHLAAMKGRVKVLEELVRAKKIAAWILTEKREPILHVCAEHEQFEALKMLIDFVQDEEFVNLKDKEFVNLKDSDDKTILHVLMAMEEFEVIEYLIEKKKGILDVNSRDVHGSTAMDVLEESNCGKPNKKIRNLLKSAKAKRAWEISEQPVQNRPSKRSVKVPTESGHKNHWNEIGEGLMVVAILIATVTFQAMTNPPGGLWQEDGNHTESIIHHTNGDKTLINASHSAGTAIMAYKFQDAFNEFKTFNTIGFVASLILIILLVSRYPLKERASVWALTFTTLIAILSMFITYTMVSNTVGNVLQPGYKSKVLQPGYKSHFYFSPLGDGAPLLWLFVVAFVGPLCGLFKRLPQRRCFQLIKLRIKRLFVWILAIIRKLCCFKVQNN